MKKVVIIGVGRLGLCFALNLERVGFEVIGIDKNKEYINQLNKRILNSTEPDVNILLSKSKIIFTDDYSVIKDADIIFICVNTPTQKDNSFYHGYIEDVMSNLKDFSKTVIIDSTTMPGYCADLQNRYPHTKIVYNPEFIAQGTIIRDQIFPDFVLIGSNHLDAIQDTKQLYEKMCAKEPIFKVMSLTEAEITKIGLNCFITSKIAMVNTIGDLAVQMKVNPDIVLDAISEDTRIGKRTMKYGFGFGGPCFPRDNKAFAVAAKNNVMNKSIDESNSRHLIAQVNNFIDNNKDEVIVINNVSYKQGTDIIECSQQLLFAVELVKRGRKVILDIPENIKIKVEEEYPKLFEYKRG